MELSGNNRSTNQKILTAGNDAHDECSICYDPFTNKTFARDCLHSFCYQCIYTWIQLRATCPLCLQPITAIIKNVRSLDDYDIEQVDPPQTAVFEEYMRDIDLPDDLFDYESSLEESMSMASDPDIYEDLSGSIDNLQSVPYSSQGSLSDLQENVFIEFNNVSDDDDLLDSTFSEDLENSLEEDEDDKDDNDDNEEDGDGGGDDDDDDEDEIDENHSENEESYEDNDDEDYDYDDNNNEDDYEGDDDDDADNYEDHVNLSDTYDDDDDDESYYWNLIYNSFSACNSDDRPDYNHPSFVLSNINDLDDSDSDQDYILSNTASLVYTSNYY